VTHGEPPALRDDRALTTSEVADLFDISKQTVLDWAEQDPPKLPGFKLGGTPGGRWRFWRSEVLAKAEEWRVGPAPREQHLKAVGE